MVNAVSKKHWTIINLNELVRRRCEVDHSIEMEIIETYFSALLFFSTRFLFNSLEWKSFHVIAHALLFHLVLIAK